jgi:hypothetical protein
MDMYIPLAVKEVRLAQHFYDRITYESVDTKPNGHSIFHLEDIFKATGCTHDDLIRICNKLKNEGLVDFFNDGRLGFVVRINEEKTKSWLAERKQDSNFNKAELNNNNLQIFLNSDGDLYRLPKSNFNYAMVKSKGLIKIIKFLKQNNSGDYIETNLIAKGLHQKASRVRTDISKINSRFKLKLNLKQNLILGRQNVGYKINPIFELITDIP